jgi:hypothetical protein
MSLEASMDVVGRFAFHSDAARLLELGTVLDRQ